MPSADDGEAGGPCQLVGGGEGDLQEAESFRIRGWGGEDAVPAAVETSAGTARESYVSKFSGFFVMPTTTLPASWSPRCTSAATRPANHVQFEGLCA
jgi:hypothetical protein